MKVRVDPDRCQGQFMCMLACPDVFLVNDDDGHAYVADENVPEEFEEKFGWLSSPVRKRRSRFSKRTKPGSSLRNVRMYDLVVRGGLVVDGSGADPFEADVAIDGDRIVEVGSGLTKGTEEIDATGLVVTPGFIDLHTHYDAQLTWDPVLAPSAWHGVTTAVIGNCGVGFAPARTEDRDWLIEIMEDVEEIPCDAMHAGMQWNWETFPEYLDALAARQHTLDIAAQVPHIALRAYVMSERARNDEPATAHDLDIMGRIVEEALRAGAVAFACSRTDVHRLKDGRLIPGSFADRDELLAMSEAVGRAGCGQIQYLGVIGEFQKDLPMMIEMSKRAGTAVHFLMNDTNWEQRLAGIEAAEAQGARLIAHFAPRAIGNMLQLRAGRNPFMYRPSMEAIADMSWPERLRRLKDPAFKAKVLSEGNGEALSRLNEFQQQIFSAWHLMYEVGDYPDFEPNPATDSIVARAEKAGLEPAEYAWDVMMRNEGNGMIYVALANYSAGDLSVSGKLVSHSGTVVSLADGGAHCTRVIDASAPTFMMAHWVRDRTRGARMPIAQVVKCLTRDLAQAYGFADRGRIRSGLKADLNVIDFDHLRLPAPWLEFDLPAGRPRLLQRAEGYRATIKNGQVTFRNGEHMGVYPGTVVRREALSGA